MNVAILEMSTVIHELRVELARAIQEIERLKTEAEKEEPPVETEGSSSARGVS